ncbi:hypothetical protein A464_872 [Salmonella bongori N268-08]|uniref:Uncharacterized protein n=1 Tax=Salmonella bongori N268-08 TaxID=1197719 RepID=S5MU22_SALBN|nr:hypothetical protein A464_872 [Salmonella bongori N268-08]
MLALYPARYVGLIKRSSIAIWHWRYSPEIKMPADRAGILPPGCTQ